MTLRHANFVESHEHLKARRHQQRERGACFGMEEYEKACQHDTPDRVDDLPVVQLGFESAEQEAKMIRAAIALHDLEAMMIEDAPLQYMQTDGEKDDASVHIAFDALIVFGVARDGVVRSEEARALHTKVVVTWKGGGYSWAE